MVTVSRRLVNLRCSTIHRCFRVSSFYYQKGNARYRTAAVPAVSGLVRLVLARRVPLHPLMSRAALCGHRPCRCVAQEQRAAPGGPGVQRPHHTVCVYASVMLTRRNRLARRVSGRVPVIQWPVTVPSTPRLPRFSGISDSTNDRSGIVALPSPNPQYRWSSFSLPLTSVQLHWMPGGQAETLGAPPTPPSALPTAGRQQGSWPGLQTVSLPPLCLTPVSPLDLGIP